MYREIGILDENDRKKLGHENFQERKDQFIFLLHW